MTKQKKKEKTQFGITSQTQTKEMPLPASKSTKGENFAQYQQQS